MILNITPTPTLNNICSNDWDAMNPENNPFLKHAFLNGLDVTQCINEKMGWEGIYFIAKDENGKLTGAAPCYLKTNSHGEFVFDWPWADAYHRYGLDYYPKLISAVPFTPVQGQRFLTAPALSTEQRLKTQIELFNAIIEFCQSQSISSYHCLFPHAEERAFLDKLNINQTPLIQRVDHQYHWTNKEYKHFDDFIGSFKSRKRRKLKQERRKVAEAGFEFTIKHGNELNSQEIDNVHLLYQKTFLEKHNTPALTRDFFKYLCKHMGEQVVIVFAKLDGETLACAVNLKSDDALFGRYWGCLEEYNSLHFETCFYQGIEYCIKHGLKRYEPGAQGEHKITRGFLPVQTYSMHWIADPRFAPAISNHAQQESQAILEYASSLWEKSPFTDDITQQARDNTRLWFRTLLLLI